MPVVVGIIRLGLERPEPADNEHGRKQHALDGIASLKSTPRSLFGQIRPESRILFEISLRHKPEVQRLDEVDELHRCTTVVFALKILCGLDVAAQNGGAEEDVIEHPDDAFRILSHVKLSCLRCPVDAEPVAQTLCHEHDGINRSGTIVAEPCGAFGGASQPFGLFF